MEGFEAILCKAVTLFQVPLAVSKRLPYTSLQGHHNQHCRLCRKSCQNFLVFIFAEDGIKSSRNRDDVDVSASAYLCCTALVAACLVKIHQVFGPFTMLFSSCFLFVGLRFTSKAYATNVVMFLSFNCRNCTIRTESGRLRCRFGRNMSAQEEQYFIK